MKKLTLSLLLVSAFLFGQPADAQVRFGMKAGVNASNVKHDFTTDDPLLGYQGGLMVDIGLSSRFSIQPSLLYVTKGFSSELEFRNAQGALTGTSRATFRPNYLELPVLVLYKTKVGKHSRLFGGVGPYMAMGINGKSDVGKFFSASSSFPAQNIVFGPKNGRPEGAYNRMDYGWTAAVGIEIRRVSLAVNYSHGLTGIGPISMADVGNFYNRSLSLTAGYWFGRAH